jgi:hypothetical protein
MPFFSVAPSEDDTPDKDTHIGMLEFGTALVLERLCDILEAELDLLDASGAPLATKEDASGAPLPTLRELTTDASAMAAFVSECREEAAALELERDGPQPARI